MRKIRENRYFMMMITLVLSMTCIGASNYIKNDEVTRLYKLISLNNITYEQVIIDIKGVTENMEVLPEVLNTRKVEGEKVLGAVQKLNNQGNVKHTLTIKDETRSENTTVYNMKIQGIGNLDEIEDMRNATIKLFEDWQVDTKETISFIGNIKGNLDKNQRNIYKNQLLKSLQGKYVTNYQDDYNVTTTAYYGYTPFIEEYTTTVTGAKINTQITFTYNEIQNATQIIIAFPFYNAPY